MESIIEILDISSLAPLIIKKPPLDRMVKLKSLSEFKRFLSKEQANLTEYEKKLARLILDNFSSVESKGTAAGGRRVLIAKLISKAGDNTPSDLNIVADKTSNYSNKITPLSGIKI